MNEMKAKCLFLAAALLTMTWCEVYAAEAEEVQIIGNTGEQSLSVGETVSLENYDITISTVEIAQTAGSDEADPAHKYLCFSVEILNWMEEDITVDPVSDWAIYYEDYRFGCALNTEAETIDSEETDESQTETTGSVETAESRTVIAPLVKKEFSLCVLLPNLAADGLESGALTLSLSIGDETYSAILE